MVRHITFFFFGIVTALSAKGQFTSATTTNKKNNPTIVQRLDSILHNRYNEVSGAWDEKMSKTSFAYDNASRDTLKILSTWDADNNKWIARTNEIKKYDGQNRIISYEHRLIGRSGKRLEYTYNAAGKLTQLTESRWLFRNTWLATKKNLYSYTPDGLLQSDTLCHSFNFLGTIAWRPIGLTQHAYNSEGKPLVDTTYSKTVVNEDKSSDWELFSRTEYEYMTTGNSEEVIFSRWNKDTEMFAPTSKKLTRYHDDSSDIQVFIQFKWNKTQSAWERTQIKQFGYEGDFMTSCENETWGDSPSAKLEVFDFDYTTNKDELLLPTSALDANEKMAFHHKITYKHIFTKDNNTDESTKIREAKYYYSATEIITATEETAPKVVHVYPNPASETLAISYPNSRSKMLFELYDTNGKKVFTRSVINNETVNITALKNGFYIYSIRTGRERIVGKLVKK